MQVVLRAISDTELVRTIWLRAGQSAVVGRTEWADFAIPDTAISSQHFELECTHLGCRIRDLDSSNGTFFNGQEVTSALQNDGDKLLAGNTTFDVSIIRGIAADQHNPSSRNN